MHSYMPTAHGESIAQESGLVAYAAKLIDRELIDDQTASIAEGTRYQNKFVENYIPAQAEAIASNYPNLRPHERADMIAALRITPDQTWRYQAGTDLVDFQPAIMTDNFVLSGVIGHRLKDQRKTGCKLLTKGDYASFGFNNIIDSTAFAGAYLLQKVIEHQERMAGEDGPSFTYQADDLSYTITFGGTGHGDFQVSSRVHAGTADRDCIMSPTGKMVPFGPLIKTKATCMHSSESEITLGLFRSALVLGGKKQFGQLVDECLDLTMPLANKDGTLEQTNMIKYGDYGDGNMDVLKIQLKQQYEGTDPYHNDTADEPVLWDLANPEKSAFFEATLAPGGMTFSNVNARTNERGNIIYLPSSQYGVAFAALIQQAQMGLGRTSPHEHLELLKTAYALAKS